jgi:hypothetical protein
MVLAEYGYAECAKMAMDCHLGEYALFFYIYGGQVLAKVLQSQDLTYFLYHMHVVAFACYGSVGWLCVCTS